MFDCIVNNCNTPDVIVIFQLIRFYSPPQMTAIQSELRKQCNDSTKIIIQQHLRCNTCVLFESKIKETANIRASDKSSVSCGWYDGADDSTTASLLPYYYLQQLQQHQQFNSYGYNGHLLPSSEYRLHSIQSRRKSIYSIDHP